MRIISYWSCFNARLRPLRVATHLTSHPFRELFEIVLDCLVDGSRISSMRDRTASIISLLVMPRLPDAHGRAVRLHLIDIPPFNPYGLPLHNGLLLHHDRLLHDRRRRHDRRCRLDNHRFSVVRTHQSRPDHTTDNSANASTPASTAPFGFAVTPTLRLQGLKNRCRQDSQISRAGLTVSVPPPSSSRYDTPQASRQSVPSIAHANAVGLFEQLQDLPNGEVLSTAPRMHLHIPTSHLLHPLFVSR